MLVASTSRRLSNRLEDVLKRDDIAPTEQSTRYRFAKDALTAALRCALEAAVFPDRFEIDEQGPLSRIDALTEELIRHVQNLECNRLLEVDDLAGKAEAILIINHVTSCIRASISKKAVTAW